MQDSTQVYHYLVSTLKFYNEDCSQDLCTDDNVEDVLVVYFTKFLLCRVTKEDIVDSKMRRIFSNYMQYFKKKKNELVDQLYPSMTTGFNTICDNSLQNRISVKNFSCVKTTVELTRDTYVSSFHTQDQKSVLFDAMSSQLANMGTEGRLMFKNKTNILQSGPQIPFLRVQYTKVFTKNGSPKLEPSWYENRSLIADLKFLLLKPLDKLQGILDDTRRMIQFYYQPPTTPMPTCNITSQSTSSSTSSTLVWGNAPWSASLADKYHFLIDCNPTTGEYYFNIHDYFLSYYKKDYFDRIDKSRKYKEQPSLSQKLEILWVVLFKLNNDLVCSHNRPNEILSI